MGDEQDSGGHSDGEDDQARDHESVGRLDYVGLLATLELEPVDDGWCDQQHGREEREQKGHEVQLPVETADSAEALIERRDEQEREQDLDSGQRDAQLARQLG